MAILGGKGGKERTDTLDPVATQIEQANQLIKEAYSSGKKGGLMLARTQDATEIANNALHISELVTDQKERFRIMNAIADLATHIGNNLEGIDQPIK